MPKKTGSRRRAAQMADVYVAGATLQDIGDEYSLSRERVRQILCEAGYDLDELKAEAKRARRRRIRREHGPAIREALTLGQTPSEVAAALGVPVDLVKRIDGSDPSYARKRKVVRRKTYAVKYTEDDVLSCLRQANAALGGVLTTAAYDNYARGRSLAGGRLWPTIRRPFSASALGSLRWSAQVFLQMRVRRSQGNVCSPTVTASMRFLRSSARLVTCRPSLSTTATRRRWRACCPALQRSAIASVAGDVRCRQLLTSRISTRSDELSRPFRLPVALGVPALMGRCSPGKEARG